MNDADNIRATLPLLKPAQQEDVIKAEARFTQPDGNGFLFTNGTGTGKTFTGLGVIKRFVRQGKGNVLLAEGQPLLAFGGGIAKALESNDAALMKEFSDLLAAGQPVDIPEGDVGLALEAVEPDLDLVPAGTVVAAISRLVPSDRHPGHVVASFRTPEGRTLTATLPWERIKNSRAVFLPGRRPAILIFYFSKTPLTGKVGLEVDAAVPVEEAAVPLDEVAEMRFILGDLVRASFRHELIHALRATGALTGNRWNRLVGHANSLGLLDLDADAPASQRMIQRTLGIEPTRTLHDA